MPDIEEKNLSCITKKCELTRSGPYWSSPDHDESERDWAKSVLYLISETDLPGLL